MQTQQASFNSILCLSLMTLAVFLMSPQVKAEDMPPMDGANMHNMMLKMNQMQACLSDIDPQAFQQAEQTITQAYTEITELCQQHKPDLAQQHAIRFSKLMQQSETFNQIERCNQPMQGLMPNMPFMGQTAEILSKHNICDLLAKS